MTRINWKILGWIAVLTLLVASGCSRQQKIERAQSKAAEYYAAGEYDKAAVEYQKMIRYDEANVEALRQLGTIYFEQGKLPESVPLFMRAKQLAPDDLEVRNRLAKLFLAGRFFAQARDEALFILDKQPTNDDAILLLSDACVTSNHVADAESRLEKLRQQVGDKPSIDLALGGLAFRMGNLTNAETYLLAALKKDPKSVHGNAALGRLYWMQKKNDEAEKALRLAAENSPIRSRHRLNLVEFKFITGAVDEGKQMLNDLIAQAPDFLTARNMLAEREFEDKQYDECQEVIKQILVRHPRNLDALLLRARIRLAKKETDAAIKDLEVLNNMHPRQASVHYQLALAHLQNNDLDKAVSSLKQATTLNANLTEASLLLAELDLRRGDTATVITAMSELIRKNPNQVAGYVALADAYRIQGNHERALDLYQRLANALPNDPRFPFLVGITSRQLNRDAEARQAFEKSLAMAPDNLDVLDQLVQLDLKEKKFAEAFQRVQQEIQKKPASAPLQFLLAEVYLAQRQYPQAETTLLKAIETDPENRAAYILLAQIYRETKQENQAITKLETYLEKNPKDTAALMQLGTIYQGLNQRAKAIATYEKVLSINPNHSPVLNNLAYLYLEDPKTLGRAYALASKAREMLPQSPSAADTLGWVRYKQGDYVDALSLLRFALEKLPDNNEVLFHLGMTYYMMLQEDSAKSALQKALQSSQEFEGRANAEQALKILNLDTQVANDDNVLALEKWMVVQPHDPIASIRLGDLYEKKGATNKAFALYQKVASVNTNAAFLLAKVAQLGLATKSTNSQAALELAQKARRLAPDNLKVLQLVGQVAFQTGDFTWAAGLLQESVARNQYDADILFELAQAKFYLGRLADAENAIADLIQKYPNSNKATEARQLQSMIGLIKNPSQAASALTQVQARLKTDPNDLVGLMLLGLIQEQQRDKAALSAYEKVYALYPNFSPVFKRLLMHYAQAKETLAKASEVGDKARRADPTDPEVAKYLGFVALSQGENSYAADLLAESVLKLQKDAEVQFYLGKAQFNLNRKPEAKSSLEKSIAMGLSEPLANEAKQLLQKLAENPQ